MRNDAKGNVDATIKSLQTLGGETSTTGLKGWFANSAACTWQRSWLQAYEQKDLLTLKTDVLGMKETANLKVMAQINNAGWQKQLASDAQEGKSSPIQRQINLNCPDAVQ